MSNATSHSLSKAYELIESERLSEARAILEPVLATDNNNVDAWWLYAHAVSDQVKAEDALQNVLRLNPAYPGASQLLRQLHEKTGRASYESTFDTDETEFEDLDIDDLMRDLEEEEAEDAISLDLDDLGDDFEDIDFDEEGLDIDALDEGGASAETKESRQRSILMRILLLVIVLLLIAVVVGVMTQRDDEDEPEEPTSIVAQSLPTSTPQTIAEVTPEVTPDIVVPSSTTTPEPTETETAPTATADPLEIGISELLGQLTAFSLASDATSVRDSDLGETLIVSVCVDGSSNSRDVLNAAMRAVAEGSSSFDGVVEAVGVTLLNCEQSTVLNTIAVPIDAALGFSAGTLTEADFLRAWRAI